MALLYFLKTYDDEYLRKIAARNIRVDEMILGLEIWVYNMEEDIGIQMSALGWTVKEKSQVSVKRD